MIFQEKPQHLRSSRIMKKSRFWENFSLGILIFAVALLFLYPILRMSYILPVNYNEGWNAYHSLNATLGQELYSLENPWTPNNYPPLSFYLIGGIGKIIGNPILAGRYISFLALLFVGFCTGWIVKQLGGKTDGAIFSSFFCLGTIAATAESYVGMNDPQLLAHAFVIGGLALYLRDRDTLWVPSLLIVVGLFIKHVLLPIPVAIALDTLLFSPKKFLKWSSFFALFLGSFTAITCVVDGASFLQQLSANRVYHWGRMWGMTRDLVGSLIVPLIFALPQSILLLQNKLTRVISIYFFISFFLGCFALSGLGVNRNLFFDFYISLSIVLGLFLARIRNSVDAANARRKIVPIGLPIILAIESAVFLFAQRPNFIQKINDLAPLEKQFIEDVRFLKQQPGDAICENLSLCFYAGKPWRYDPFLTAQMMYNREIDEKEVIATLKTKKFRLVQLNKPLNSQFLEDLPDSTTVALHTDRFTVNFLHALAKHYILVRKTSTGAFYRSKTRE